MAALCILLLMACFTDYRWYKIPNQLNLLILLVGFGYRFWDSGGYGLIQYFLNCFFVFIIMYPFFRIDTIGAGDIKLFAATAGYLSGKAVFCFLFTSLLVAAFLSILKLIAEGSTRERLFYLYSYVLQVIQGGQWKPYFHSDARKGNGIRLSGPVLVAILLHLGGVY